MKMKKVLAVLSALCMMCAVVPVLPESVQDSSVISASALGFGTYENLKYTKYADYVEISGVTDKEAITEANIPAEIDSLPVTSIGYEAFAGCTNLTSVTIPDGITNIEFQAFDRCTNLTSVEIPDGVTTIGSSAFRGCESLTSVTIPESVTSFGNRVFNNTPWLKTKQEENPLVIVNHILIDGSTCTGDVIVPDGVASIQGSAFEYGKLSSLTTSDSVTSVNLGAFRRCSYLTSITISSSVQTITSFIQSCPLTGITVDENNPNYTSVDGILFNKDKTKLIQYPAGKTETEYDIPDSVTVIGDGAFWGSNFASVTIPEGVTSIGTYAFYLCTELDAVIIPESVNSIGESAFVNDHNLETVVIKNPNCEISDILGWWSSINKDEATIIYGYENSTAQAYAEKYDRQSQFALIGTEPTTGIYGNLKYKKYAYADYVMITGVTDEGITEAVIPAKIEGLPVTCIGKSAFSGCSGLTSVTIPDGVTSIGDFAFQGCTSMLSFEVSENNTAYSSKDGVLFNKDKTKLERYPCGKSETEYIIPDSVTSIGSSAFSYCEKLSSVTIPDSVISIENYAFEGCTGLTSVTIPESVTSIGSMAFSGKSKSPFMLTSVIIKNPDCEIYDSDYTFSHTAAIYGYENSTAQAYAEKYGYQFELIGSEPDTTETKELESGDADGSGKIDILDVITINKAILGKEKLSDKQLKAVDFNGDGKPDAGDSLILMKYIVGLIDTLF